MSNDLMRALQPSVWLNTEFNTAWFKENAVNGHSERSAPLFAYADMNFQSYSVSPSVCQQFKYYSYDQDYNYLDPQHTV